MLTILLLAAAVFLFGGDTLWGKALRVLAGLPKPKLTLKQLAGVGLLLVAVLTLQVGPRSPVPPPMPEPTPELSPDLRGKFTGPTAAEDSATVAALTAELADEIDWDGRQEDQFLKTGVSIDNLRKRARELRCRGVSIGARQPAARDAIAKHLEDAVGTSGGPIDDAARAKWVTAFREISEAAADVTK